jgi:lysozyme family protein
MANFETAYARTEKNEHRPDTVNDDLVNNPSDRGRETYKGISRRHNGDWPGWLTVDRWKSYADAEARMAADDDLQKLVVDFYRAIWLRLKCDQIEAQEIADELFDAAVNCGTATATKFLQATLNSLSRSGTAWRFIDVDGRLGLATLSAIKSAVGKLGAELVTITMKVARGAYYLDLVKHAPDQSANLPGWIRRMDLGLN